MRVLVISDSHGLKDELQMIRERHSGIDHLIHCGDSELEPGQPAMEGYDGVAGNCDWFTPNYPNDLVVPLDDRTKLLVTHGHLYNVKMSLTNLLYKTEEVGATVVCFGHTHVAGSTENNGIATINPGSIRLPRGRKDPTYALLNWDSESRILSVQYYGLDGHSVKELEATYSL